MCSILGIIDFKNNDNRKEKNIRKINLSLSHRGPDDDGYFFDEYVALAFNRLSILDLEKGNQPVINKHVISIFNGEIYNFKNIRNELETLGHKFLTNSDSEIIPAAYLQWGMECVKKFEGMFAISLYDLRKKKVFLIRDRVGIKPLYYARINGNLLFCSEIKGIISYPNFEKKINYNAIASYLAFRYPSDNNNNFFKFIKRVDPGSYLEIDLIKNNIKNVNFWSIPEVEDFDNFSEKYYFEKLENLLISSVKSHLISDVPVGVLLSGGLDSSIISSIVSKKANRNLKTFSVSFSEKQYDESVKAKIISKHIGSEHIEVNVGKREFLDNLENIINIKTSPISIPHEYPIYKLSKKIRESVKVVLSGEGADEFFGGYARMQKSAFDYNKGKFFGGLNKYKIINSLFNIDKSFDFKNDNYLKYFFSKYNWFSFNEINNLFRKEIIKEISFNAVQNPWINTSMKYTNSDNYSKAFLMFQENHLQCLLDRLDIMTMANSVEARVPFLDHKIIEFINKVPFKYKIKWRSNIYKFISIFSNNHTFSEKYDENKYLLRELGAKYLPEKMAKEKKLGFPLPMNNWMRDEKIKDILFDKKTKERGFFNIKEINNLFNHNNDGIDPYDFSGKKVWMLTNIELWIRQFID